jgi:hypothetical protein
MEWMASPDNCAPAYDGSQRFIGKWALVGGKKTKVITVPHSVIKTGDTTR